MRYRLGDEIYRRGYWTGYCVGGAITGVTVALILVWLLT